MYIIINESISGNLIDYDSLTNLKGFNMGSSAKIFTINNTAIKNICIEGKRLAHPLVSEKVNKLYSKLIKLLTELLVSDDDSGDSFREALNQIERFRRMINNKYKMFLTRLEFEKMEKQLNILEKEAKKRLIEIEESYQDVLSNNRSK